MEDNDATTKKFEQEGLHNEKYFQYIIAKDSKLYVLDNKVLEWNIM